MDLLPPPSLDDLGDAYGDLLARIAELRLATWAWDRAGALDRLASIEADYGPLLAEAEAFEKDLRLSRNQTQALREEVRGVETRERKVEHSVKLLRSARLAAAVEGRASLLVLSGLALTVERFRTALVHSDGGEGAPRDEAYRFVELPGGRVEARGYVSPETPVRPEALQGALSAAFETAVFGVSDQPDFQAEAVREGASVRLGTDAGVFDVDAWPRAYRVVATPVGSVEETLATLDRIAAAVSRSEGA